jgi:hypothetical protein
MSCNTSQCLHCKCLFKGERGLKIHRTLKIECLDAYLKSQKHFSRKTPSTSKQIPTPATKIQATKRSKKQRQQESKSQNTTNKFEEDDSSDDSRSFVSFNFPNDNDGIPDLSDNDSYSIHHEKENSNHSKAYGKGSNLSSNATSIHCGSDHNGLSGASVVEMEHERFANSAIEDETSIQHVVADGDSPDESLLKIYDEIQTKSNTQINVEDMSTQEMFQIDLLKTLMRLKAPIKTYKEVLDWARRANESGFHFSTDHPSREKLISKLQDRLNITTLKPKEKHLLLPHSKKIVNMVYFDAKAVFASMLTCPVLNQDKNYLFNGYDTPSTPPPDKPKYIGDLNTSRGYIENYTSLITNPTEDVLLPCVLAIDATNCDTFGRLKMEPLTISYGLMKQSVRNSPIAMRILGYVNHCAKADDSNACHLEENNIDVATNDVPHTTTPCLQIPKPACTQSAQNVNDYHAQIKFILEESGFLELQDRGFKWILHYRGEPFPVTFRTYVPFIIGDTEGHDQLCGHYKCRTGNVAQLCRACKCPTRLSGWSKANFPHRNISEFKRLMNNQDTDALQQMSQHYLANGFDRVRFGDRKRGIFGAVPGEILHLVLLGWFTYTMEAFIAQAGSKTKVMKQYDKLFTKVGNLLSRQSDRDLPRTVFRKGLSAGSHLMAEEVPGCLLVMLFTMHTKEYMDIFSNRPKYTQELGLGNQSHVTDWITLLSSLLQWLAWLKQDRISKRMVDQSQKATRWLMRLFKFVSPRTKGMCNNTIKMHLVLHISDDIIRHGVPQNFNSAFMESAHIPLAKDTSRNTQKRATSFTLQAAKRYVENLTILKASWYCCSPTKNWSTIDEDNTPTDCNPCHSIVTTADAGVLRTIVDHNNDDNEVDGGRKFVIYQQTNSAEYICHWKRIKPTDKSQNAGIGANVKDFLIKYCLPAVASGGVLSCFTSYNDKQTQQLYRAHPNYMGAPWYDCAMVRWHNYPECIPARLLAFVDLSNLLPRISINIPEANQYHIGPGLYAVVESFSKTNKSDDKQGDSSDEDDEYSNSLVARYKRDELGNGSGRPILYLAEVGSLVHPVAGIPDTNSERFHRGRATCPMKYLFLIKRRNEWPTCWESIIRSSTQGGDESSSEEEDLLET